ncbi:MAG: type II secretion system protein [Pedosphaera sp.]|nr:type II secretion system protein [Pedosphaera sp.]
MSVLAASRLVRSARGGRRSAFTLLEIMIVVGLIGIFLVVGIPAFVMMREKADLERSVDYLVTACTTARTQAILSGRAHDMIFNSVERTLSVVMVAGESMENGVVDPTDERGETQPIPPQKVWRFPEGVSLEVNAVSEDEDGIEYRCRFYPNAICDDFQMVLSDVSGEYQILLEAPTGQPIVSNLADR